MGKGSIPPAQLGGQLGISSRSVGQPVRADGCADPLAVRIEVHPHPLLPQRPILRLLSVQMGGFPGKIHVGLRFRRAYLAIGQMPVPQLADIPRIPIQPLLF
ncbi:hypothetical protein D3C75_1016590 [compost metagenome]